LGWRVSGRAAGERISKPGAWPADQARKNCTLVRRLIPSGQSTVQGRRSAKDGFEPAAGTGHWDRGRTPGLGRDAGTGTGHVVLSGVTRRNQPSPRPSPIGMGEGEKVGPGRDAETGMGRGDQSRFAQACTNSGNPSNVVSSARLEPARPRWELFAEEFGGEFAKSRVAGRPALRKPPWHRHSTLSWGT